MYRLWKKKLKCYNKDTHVIARNLEDVLRNVSSVSELQKMHREWLKFIAFHDSSIMDSHWNLESFWDQKVICGVLFCLLTYFSAISLRVKSTRLVPMEKRKNQRKNCSAYAERQNRKKLNLKVILRLNHNQVLNQFLNQLLSLFLNQFLKPFLKLFLKH